MYSDRKVPRISIQPHIDPAVYATVLYLNEKVKAELHFSPINQLD